jgi:5-methylcytosine-specific restriction enzyme A
VRSRERIETEPWRWVYFDPRWERLRLAALAWDGYRCVVVEEGVRCPRTHRPPRDPLHVHHIVPIRVDPSRAFDADNVVSLCAEHHAQVEAELRRL